MITTMPANADLFKSEAEALVNPVNCVGVMGAGLAKEFRVRWPRMFLSYLAAVKAKQIHFGHCHVYHLVKEDQGIAFYIINFPTKYHWHRASRLEHIASGLRDLAKIIQANKIRSIAVPALGCGLGGLAWEPVFDLMVKTLSDMDCEVEIYPPQEQTVLDRAAGERG